MIINDSIKFTFNNSFRLSRKEGADRKENQSEELSLNAVKTMKQIYDEFKQKMKDMLDPTSGMSEEEKANYDESVNWKIKTGEKLSDEEMRYIQIKSSYMYALISRVQLQRRILEEKLKNCHSKQEVEEVYNNSVAHIDKKDPVKEALLAAYDNVTLEFKKSDEYKNLPQKTVEEVKEKNEIRIVSSRVEEKEGKITYTHIYEAYSVYDIHI